MSNISPKGSLKALYAGLLLLISFMETTFISSGFKYPVVFVVIPNTGKSSGNAEATSLLFVFVMVVWSTFPEYKLYIKGCATTANPLDRNFLIMPDSPPTRSVFKIYKTDCSVLSGSIFLINRSFMRLIITFTYATCSVLFTTFA